MDKIIKPVSYYLEKLMREQGINKKQLSEILKVNQLSITKEFQSRPYPSKFTKLSQVLDANRKAQVITTGAIYRMMTGDKENE